MEKLTGSTEKSGNFVRNNQTMSGDANFKFVAKRWYDTLITMDAGLDKLEHGYAVTEDIVANLNQMQPVVDKQGKFAMLYQDGRTFNPTPHCLNQIGSWFGIGTWFPTSLVFNDERENDAKDANTLVEVVKNAKRFVNPDKNFMFRTRKDGSLRAMMTAGYLCIDNRWFLESLKAMLPGAMLSHWDRCDGADTIYGNILLPETLREEKDSDYGAGLSVGNSEIGVRTLSVLPWLYRAICMNGCIWDQQKGTRYNRVHRGKNLDLVAEFQKIHDHINLQIPLAKHAIDVLLESHKLLWDANSVEPMFVQAAVDLKLGKADANKFKAQYQVEPEPSAFGLINALTRAGQLMTSEKWVRVDEYAASLTQEKSWNVFTKKAKALTSKEISAMLTLAS